MTIGTIALTNGSKTVKGTGTTFTADLKRFDVIYTQIGGVPYQLAVDSVDSDLQVTLISAYDGATVTGNGYTAIPYLALVTISNQMANQVSNALRADAIAAKNWNRLLTENGDVTITALNGISYTGASWPKISALAQNANLPAFTQMANEVKASTTAAAGSATAASNSATASRTSATASEASRQASDASAARAAVSEQNAAASKAAAAGSATASEASAVRAKAESDKLVNNNALAGAISDVNLTTQKVIFKGNIQAPALELQSSAPYIDFRYGNATGSPTTRVQAESATRIGVSNGLRVGANLQVDGDVNINGTQTVGGSTFYSGSTTYLGASNGANQGLHFRWNEDSNFSGAGSLIVNPGLGNGGFRMRFVTKENNANTGIISFTRTGGIQASDYISSPNQVWSQGGRVKAFTAITAQYIGVNIDGDEYGINIFKSDARLKKNIQDADSQGAYDAIKSLRLRSFDFKPVPNSDEDGPHWEYGFVAQEAQEYLKGAVIMDRLSYLQVDPLALCGYLIGCSQKLQEKVEGLEAKVADMDKLAARLAALEERLGAE